MIPNHLRIFLARGATHTRRLIDRLINEPATEGVFVFANRRRDRPRVLWRDRTG